MRIKVKLHGHLPWYLQDRKKEVELALPEGASIRRVLEELHLPFSEVALVSLNNQKQEIDRALQDGEMLEVFPVVSGG